MVETTVSYLEMTTHARRTVPPPIAGLTVEHVRTPNLADYRALYTAVGQDYHWLSRRKMPDDVLAALINDPEIEYYVLHVAGRPAGFAELDTRRFPDVEIVQFGLTPEFIGRGLGKWFLQWTIDRAWSTRPQRLWLHTCTLDHPAALPNYQQAGFVLYKQEVIQREL